MKRLLALLLGVSLTGCSTTNTNNLIALSKSLHDNGCHVTINVQAGTNLPGPNFQTQGSIDCPSQTSQGMPTPPATNSLVGPSASEQPAPAATLLHP